MKKLFILFVLFAFSCNDNPTETIIIEPDNNLIVGALIVAEGQTKSLGSYYGTSVNFKLNNLTPIKRNGKREIVYCDSLWKTFRLDRTVLGLPYPNFTINLTVEAIGDDRVIINIYNINSKNLMID